MAEHKLFTKTTKMKVYFTHPASPWERVTDENINGLIRQFFPKGGDFNKVTRKKIKHAQDLLNGGPRKILDWETLRLRRIDWCCVRNLKPSYFS